MAIGDLEIGGNPIPINLSLIQGQFFVAHYPGWESYALHVQLLDDCIEKLGGWALSVQHLASLAHGCWINLGLLS